MPEHSPFPTLKMPPQGDRNLNHRYHLGILLFILLALIAGIACTEDGSSPDSPPTPTPTPTPTPPTTAQINAEDMPLPSKEWLSRFSHMLSVVPANYGPVLFLDLKEMRYKPEVLQALTAQMAPALAAILSGATKVIEGAVLARDGDDGGAIVVLSTPLDIATMLSVASSLEISSKTPEPETFREHQIWSIEDFGARLAIGSVDKSTSVAVAGSSPPDVSHLTRVKGALDTFDGLTPSFLDSDALSLVANKPTSGCRGGLIRRLFRLGQHIGRGKSRRLQRIRRKRRAY